MPRDMVRVSLSDDVCTCVSSLSAFRMAARGKGRGGSVLFVVIVLACFPSRVVGVICTDSYFNVKAENMGACNTCEASCSGDADCGYGCASFFGDYPTLASCKSHCNVRPQMNRPQRNPAVWCLCMPQTRCVCVGWWRGLSSCSFLTDTNRMIL